MKNAQRFLYGKILIVYAFEENVFALPKEEMPQHEEWTEEKKGEEYIPPKERPEIIAEEEKSINNELFKDYFKYQSPSHMYKNLNDTKNTERNKIQLDLIKNALTDLKNRIKNMFENEKIIERTDEIVDIVERIIEFNNQNQEGQGLKILTPDEMLSRLPVSLAQLKAGSNSEKLKNEIRQLLYSLYRSKKLTKIIYNNLINVI